MSNSEGTLERNLGLPATIAIAMGSMIGSGIFILPGVAYLEVGNASVVLAFLAAGLLTIPAALSAAELATAIPESGGSYTYIQRGMGPLVGTVAGVGNWMVLNFKTALALIGGLPYLVFLFPSIATFGVPFDPIIIIAVALTILFTVVNIASSDSAGRAQNIIVLLMVIVLAVVIIASVPELVQSQPDGLTAVGGGFLAATSLVFVAYAGVIKVTSVAEEIKRPDRNIPLGIIISLAVTTAVYVAITYIAVATVDIPNLVANVPVSEGGLSAEGEGAIIAIAADNIIGPIGAALVVAAALLALASTANSGILSASRYPLAMARDGLANRLFGHINPETGTPVPAILITGGAVIFMVTFLPVDSVARFGAAFQIIVFMLVSLAVIGFREASPDAYDPSYLSPAYPYLQLFGVFSGLLLLTQLGLIAFIGTALITGMAIAYYRFYARPRFRTEGEVKTTFREELAEAAETQARTLLNSDEEYRVLIALWQSHPDVDSTRDKDELLDLVATLSSHGLDVRIDVVEFEQARKETLNEKHPDIDTANPPWIEAYDNVSYRRVTARSVRKSIVEYATYNGVDLIAHAFAPDTGRFGVIDDDLEWALENAPCDSAVLFGQNSTPINKIAVVSNGPTYVPTKLLLADSLAVAHTASLELIHLINPNTPEERAYAEAYVDAVRKELRAPTTVQIVETDDPMAEATRRTRNADVMLTELNLNTLLRRIRPAPAVAAGLARERATIFVYSDRLLKFQTIYKRLLMRYIFRGLA